MTLLDFTRDYGRAPLDPANLDFQLWLAWHDDPARIYLALVASDDAYKNVHDFSVDWYSSLKDLMLLGGNNDGIMFGIDGNHSGGEGLPLRDLETRDWLEITGETQRYDALPTLRAGRHWMIHIPGTEWMRSPGRPCLPTGRGVAG